MTRLEMLIQILQEESAEVIQASSKINRFGLDGAYPCGTPNLMWLTNEINDFNTLVSMVHEELFKNDCEMPGLYSPTAINSKKARVEEMLLKSVKNGCLVN